MKRLKRYYTVRKKYHCSLTICNFSNMVVCNFLTKRGITRRRDEKVRKIEYFHLPVLPIVVDSLISCRASHLVASWTRGDRKDVAELTTSVRNIKSPLVTSREG